jgi:hypothetical protein
MLILSIFAFYRACLFIPDMLTVVAILNYIHFEHDLWMRKLSSALLIAMANALRDIIVLFILLKLFIWMHRARGRASMEY